MNKDTGQRQTFAFTMETHSDSLDHEADVANVLELGALVDGIDGLDVTGDLSKNAGKHGKKEWKNSVQLS